MNAIETISYKGHEIGIYYDEYAESPRVWDNLSMIYSNSRRYNPDGLDIDDLMNKIGISEFPGFDDILSRMEHDYIAYRVCIVDHSCVALSLNSPVPNPYMGTECNSYDDKTAKQNMLVLLKRSFPGVKFYCRKNGSSSYCVRWTDGPTEKMVGKICSMFADTTFNGYQDIEENIGDEFTALYGGIGYTPDLERSYSDKVWNEAKEKFYAKHPEAVGVNEHSQFVPKSYSEYVWRDDYASTYGCVRRYLKDVDLYQEPEEKPVKTTLKTVGNAGDLQLVDYSEKAVAIIGNTREYVEKLKELGGRFNGKLKCGAGWVFSKKREPELREAFSL